MLPATAGAHAFLKQSQPASGSTVGPSLRAVRLIFDEGVKPAPGIKVLRGGGQSVVAGAPFQPAAMRTGVSAASCSGRATRRG